MVQGKLQPPISGLFNIIAQQGFTCRYYVIIVYGRLDLKKINTIKIIRCYFLLFVFCYLSLYFTTLKKKNLQPCRHDYIIVNIYRHNTYNPVYMTI